MVEVTNHQIKNGKKQITSIDGESITLEFATLEDKRLIYDMLISPEVKDFMFSSEQPEPTWEEFDLGESDGLFSGEQGAEGSYLLIKIDGVSIGAISYYLHSGRLKSAELDIWISSTKYLGKGYGTQAIKLLIDFVRSTYNIKTFIIRPWRKNVNAIKAYKKCGFKEFDPARLKDYYSEELFSEHGEGDYGIGETANLIYELE